MPYVEDPAKSGAERASLPRGSSGIRGCQDLRAAILSIRDLDGRSD